MFTLPIILLVIAGVVFIYVIGVYNSLQRLKTQIKASIQEIGNQLKRQVSMIPNLEAAVKGQLKHESGIYKMLTDARKSVNLASESGKTADIDKAINNLQTMVPKIQVTIESNPELKADATITKFMAEIADTADKLSYARRSVIDLSQSFNEKLMVFPSNLIANLFGFKEEKGLDTPLTGSHVEVSESDTKDVKVNL